MDKIKIQDNDTLVRDSRNQAVLNTDSDSLNKYRINRNRTKQIDDVVKEFTQLKSEFGEIKNLLRELLEKSNK